MLKLIGSILVIAGCAGIAGAFCRDLRQRILLLKQIRKIYEDMKYYIAYQRITVPDALLRLSENKALFLADAFGEIYKEQRNGKQEFPFIWEQKIENALSETALKLPEKKLLLEFPSCLGFMKDQAQAGALDELLRETVQRIEELEEEQKSKNKMIMSLGLAGGIFISILLI